MDLNNDGNMDILSGSYSRKGRDMAGLFQVLWGNDDGTFETAQALKGTDDEPLVIPGSRERNLTDRICTRPTAADIDNDGDLDLIVGNFAGSFFLFHGEGDGKFSPEAEKMTTGDEDLKVNHHSDPFLVDWDGDGDLDMLSGSNSGGVSISTNQGTVEEAEFTAFEPMIPGVKVDFSKTIFGDAHITGPQTATRVWADDVNGDGKLDLLIGDSVRLTYAAEGLDEATAREKLEEWKQEQMTVSRQYSEVAKRVAQLKKEAEADTKTEGESEDVESEEGETENGEAEEAIAAAQDELKAIQKKLSEFYSTRSKIVKEDMTGFVWVYYQK